jgi:integrase
VATFARAVVGAAHPQNPQRARVLLFAASRLGTFAASRGVEVSAAACLHPSVIERFIVTGCDGLSAGTRGTLRTNLRFLAVRVVGSGPAPVALSRERAKARYTEAELAGYLAMADAQPSPARRQRLSALICLGAGAGLPSAELRFVRGGDVASRSGGVLVEVRGKHPRAVPVLARYHARLRAAATFARDDLIVGGLSDARRNVTSRLIATTSGGMDLPRFEVGRLRATWLATCAAALGLKAFMDAAGITCFQRLGDVVVHLDQVDEAGAVALLGGAS